MSKDIAPQSYKHLQTLLWWGQVWAPHHTNVCKILGLWRAILILRCSCQWCWPCQKLKKTVTRSIANITWFSSTSVQIQHVQCLQEESRSQKAAMNILKKWVFTLPNRVNYLKQIERPASEELGVLNNRFDTRLPLLNSLKTTIIRTCQGHLKKNYYRQILRKCFYHLQNMIAVAGKQLHKLPKFNFNSNWFKLESSLTVLSMNNFWKW